MPNGGPWKSRPMPGSGPACAMSQGCTCRCRIGARTKSPPDSKNDARYRGQELNGNTHRPAQAPRAQLGQEYGDAKANRHRQQQSAISDGHECSVNRRERAELLGDRIPDLACQEVGV